MCNLYHDHSVGDEQVNNFPVLTVPTKKLYYQMWIYTAATISLGKTYTWLWQDVQEFGTLETDSVFKELDTIHLKMNLLHSDLVGQQIPEEIDIGGGKHTRAVEGHQMTNGSKQQGWTATSPTVMKESFVNTVAIINQDVCRIDPHGAFLKTKMDKVVCMALQVKFSEHLVEYIVYSKFIRTFSIIMHFPPMAKWYIWYPPKHHEWMP